MPDTDRAPLTTKNLVIDGDEIAAVSEVLAGGDLSGNSTAVADYESALREFFGSAHAVACSSGTAAIHLALVALEIGPGDEVLVPATAPAMSGLGVCASGARPVFVDVATDLDTGFPSFAVDLDDAQSKITSATRAVLSVAMWGYPADGDVLDRWCLSRGLAHVEDAAQAHGTVADGQLVGTRGVIGTFSTHARKLVATGEGGFCLTDDDTLARRLREVRNLGQPVDGGPFGTTIGFNYKLAAALAAIGTVQIARLPARLARRRETWTDLGAAFGDHPVLRPLPLPPGGRPNGAAFLAVADSETASAMAAALTKAGILSDTTVYDYSPIYSAPALAGFGQRCPTAEALCRNLLALPCHEAVEPHHVAAMVDAIQGAVPT